MLITNPALFYAIALPIAYLFGSIPTGLLLAKWMGLGDLRKIGSGNIGATNALRTGNKKLAIFTLIGDALKGVIAVWVVYFLNVDFANGAFPFAPVWAGIVAVLGHIFPVWLKFKGGKGVATAWGVLCALHWPTGICCAVIWFVAARLSRYSSMGAIMAALNAPVYVYAYGGHALAVPFAILSVILIITHRANIRRLMRGEEPVIQLKKA